MKGRSVPALSAAWCSMTAKPACLSETGFTRCQSLGFGKRIWPVVHTGVNDAHVFGNPQLRQGCNEEADICLGSCEQWPGNLGSGLPSWTDAIARGPHHGLLPKLGMARRVKGLGRLQVRGNCPLKITALLGPNRQSIRRTAKHCGGLRLLPVRAAARLAGALMDEVNATGQSPGFARLAIAATAGSGDLTVPTRNLRHLAPLDVRAVNPLESLPNRSRAGVRSWISSP